MALETDGGDTTLNRGGLRYSAPDDGLFENIHGPGYRALYDLSDLDNSRFVIATGQSGNPLSAFYGSLRERWRDGGYVTLSATQEVAHRLILSAGVGRGSASIN